MDVTDEFQEIRLLFTDNRFISVLKEVTASAMPSVIFEGITG
jgi:hypothetical protein